MMAGIGAALSAVMNNVGALALLMPVDIQAAEKAKRSPALTLMPLSFATILGGLVTLIGTPPNIIVSTIREKELGRALRMFDYAPVGIGCARCRACLFVAFIGWRLLPKATREREAGKELFELGHLSGRVDGRRLSRRPSTRPCAISTMSVTSMTLQSSA